MKFKKISLLTLLALTLSGSYSVVYAANNGKDKEDNGSNGKGHEKDNGLGHGYDDGPGQGPGNGNGYGHNKNTNAPIDGGLSLLIAAGVGAGLKKANDRRKGQKAREKSGSEIL